MRFLPGQSGNPAGRPAGALNKTTLAFQAAFEAEAEGAVKNVVERSKNGHPTAMRLCMERAVPAGRHRRLAFRLPRIRTPADAEAAIDVVMDGFAEGGLTLEEVSALLNLVERLLGLAEGIAHKKKMRAKYGHDIEDEETAAVAGGPTADASQDELSAPDVDTAEPTGDPAAPLYSPVNHGSGLTQAPAWQGDAAPHSSQGHGGIPPESVAA
jgi:hypothetical protein